MNKSFLFRQMTGALALLTLATFISPGMAILRTYFGSMDFANDLKHLIFKPSLAPVYQISSYFCLYFVLFFIFRWLENLAFTCQEDRNFDDPRRGLFLQAILALEIDSLVKFIFSLGYGLSLGRADYLSMALGFSPFFEASYLKLWLVIALIQVIGVKKMGKGTFKKV